MHTCSGFVSSIQSLMLERLGLISNMIFSNLRVNATTSSNFTTYIAANLTILSYFCFLQKVRNNF